MVTQEGALARHLRTARPRTQSPLLPTTLSPAAQLGGKDCISGAVGTSHGGGSVAVIVINCDAGLPGPPLPACRL